MSILTHAQRQMGGSFEVFRDGRRLGMAFQSLGSAVDYAYTLATIVRRQWNEGEPWPIADLESVNLCGHPTIGRTMYVVDVVERRTMARLESITIAMR